MLGHIVQTHRTRRGDAGIPLWTLFCDNWGETAVAAEILGLEQGGTGHESRSAQEGAFGAVGISGLGRLAPVAEAVSDGPVMAAVHAVEAGDAAARIHLVLCGIYAGGLALPVAEMAAHAFAGVYFRAEERIAGNAAQYGTDRAYIVTPAAAAHPGEYDEHDEGQQRDDEQRKTAQPYLFIIEGV